MDSVNDPEFSRNFGFWSKGEQQALLDSRVALAGVGGDGYQLGLSLLRMGVRRVTAADPEVFERENVNRVPGATASRIGRNKALCFRDDALDINPDAEVIVYIDGVTPGNVGAFVGESDLVIDETELTDLELGTLISDCASKRDVPVLIVMNIGFAAQAFSFDPGAQGFREMMAIDPALSLTEIAELKLDLSRCVAYLPPYLDASVLADLEMGASIPSVVQGVNIAAGLGASQAFLHLVNGVAGSVRPNPTWFPSVVYIDSLTGESGVEPDIGSAYQRRLGELTLNTTNGKVTALTYAEFA